MPRLSRTGLSVSPTLGAAAPLSVHGLTVAALAGASVSAPAWLTDRVLAFQACDAGGCRVERYDLDAATRQPIHSGGANVVVAGCGSWAILAADGYRDSDGRHEPTWRPLDVDPDTGWILATKNGTDVFFAHDPAHPIATGPVATQATIRGGVVWWSRDYRTWQRWPDGYGCPIPMSNLRAGADGRTVCGNWDHGLVVLDALLPARGVILAAVGHNPDLTLLPNGTVRVVASATAGEAPGDLQVYDVDLRGVTAEVNGLAHSWTDLTRPMLPPVVDPDPPAGVPGFRVPDHPIRVAIFGDAGFHLATGDPRHDDQTVAPWGVFVDLADARPGHTVAEKSDQARAIGLPLFAYKDGLPYGLAEVPQVPGVLVVPTLQAYPVHTAAAFDASLDELAQHYDVAVIPAMYRQIDGAGRYHWPLAEVLGRLGRTWERCATHPRVRYVLPFHQNRTFTRSDGAICRDGVGSRPEFIQASVLMHAAAAAYQRRPTAPSPPPTTSTAGMFPRARVLTHA